MTLLHKAFRLNLLHLGKQKRASLAALASLATREANRWATVLHEQKPRTRTAFHHLAYQGLRDAGLPAQLACDVVSQVWENRKTRTRVYRGIPLRFNFPRSAGHAQTHHARPVLTIATGVKGRLALPLAQDGAYDRYTDALGAGFVPKQVRLCATRKGLRLWLLAESEVAEPAVDGTLPVVGVDLGVRTLAAISVVRGDRVLEQHYFGRDLYPAQRDAGLRRSMLQEARDTGTMPDRARRGLRRLRGWEDRFTTTRCWQVAHQVVSLAEKHGASIAVEDLKDLRDAPGHRKSRRKTARLPYSKFRSSLESLALERGVPLVAVPPAYTSRRCSRCGEMGQRKVAAFHCPGCGYLGNADRNASVNIARIVVGAGKHGPQQLVSPQDSHEGGRVNGPVGNGDGSGGVGWQPYSSPEFKPPVSTGGR